MPVTYLIRFPPAKKDSYHLYGERSRSGDTAPDHNPTVAKDDSRKIEKSTDEIGKGRYAEKDRACDHGVPSPLSCLSSACIRSQSLLNFRSKEISFLLVLPAMIILVPTLPGISAAAQSHSLRWPT